MFFHTAILSVKTLSTVRLDKTEHISNDFFAVWYILKEKAQPIF